MSRNITITFGTVFMLIFYKHKCAWHNLITNGKIFMKPYNNVYMDVLKKEWTYNSMALSICLSYLLSICM